ncbi:SH3 domain-containing protein [Shimia thalassica]|uniref:SH3 domain-containing protein n=1 Tax=Shimia thalassica TaxID=1715693 RepID=UPI0026E4729C|nr:SH3 domain-containing protein [Shimia thalassica]MDO6481505.1 SH3 domain-containing protein [Shimia thalassica]
MTRFIFLSFAFLGWAFYEFSGGGDFVPETPKRLEKYADESVPPPKVTSTQSTEPVQVASLAAPVAAVPTTFAAQSAKQPVVEQVAFTAPTPAPNQSLVSAPFANTSNEALFTLSDPASVPQTATTQNGTPTLAGLTQPEAPRDLRKVRANRINMRNGPGTQYNVLAKLSKGEKILVLQDPGKGWVKFRVIDSGRVGWAAESLLETAS